MDSVIGGQREEEETDERLMFLNFNEVRTVPYSTLTRASCVTRGL